MINYYTDGSARKDKTGAWGFIRVDDNGVADEQVFAAHNMTNQKAELMGILAACNDAAEKFPRENIIIHTDSAYAQNCYSDKWYDKWIRNGWLNSAGKPVANKPLWEQLIPYFICARYLLTKVKGHDTNKWNNYIDDLVQTKSKEMMDKNG